MPYLRHFTETDLGRTRLAPRIDHLWEIVSAVQLLQHPVALANPELSPTLIFPINPATRLLAEERRPGDHLARW